MVYCDDMDCKFKFNFLNYKENFFKKINSSVEIEFKFFLIVFFLAPLITGLPEKISILFFL
ncbi:hypothetical protein DKE52_013805 [Acinetobacter pittii]|uniref:Uncharacterized protein n=1 Tax=Acinetobacter pittii TaxID=48296 RepID=A0A3G6YM31_ACIPI|nr:hypothetical protein DKE52_013805 [Acinetobacter pittii]